MISLAIESRTLSGKNPRLTINLTELFGQRVPDSRAFKEGVAQAVIDMIRQRTSENIDRNNKTFKSYSKAYAKTLEFQAAGKTRGNPNLKLTGDMLGFMDLIDDSRDTITIGWNDREEQLKAHGHITGNKNGPGVQRDFFGLPSKSYDNIATQFSLPAAEPTRSELNVLGTLTTLRELFSLGQTSS